jgi:transposase
MTTHISSELSAKIINIYHQMIEKTPSIYEVETKTYRPVTTHDHNICDVVWNGVTEELKYG